METIEKKRSLAEIIAEKKQKREATAQESLSPFLLPVIETKTKIEAPTNSLAAILAAKRKERPPSPALLTEIKEITPTEEIKENLLPLKEEETEIKTYDGAFSLDIILNERQELAKELAFAGKSFCLVGAAGTGKTTAQREVASSLVRQNLLGIHNFRIQGGNGLRIDAPSIAFVAYTRIAAGNLKRAIHKDPELESLLTHNITTVHNLLEYAPEYYWDNEKNEERFRFSPNRTRHNLLDITHLIIEESSMLGLDLWIQLFDAMRPGTQIIFIGDINQLPPVFGASILNYALVQLPVVELTHVYRQKEGSSILDNAHKILAGLSDLKEDANFRVLRMGEVQHTEQKTSMVLGATLPKWYAAGEYDPEQDIFLSPFNKNMLGTDNMNKIISQFVGDLREATVFEIICGMNTIYLAEGDKILYNKQVGYVSKIHRNGDYCGKTPKKESKNLTRFGSYRGSIGEDEDEDFELAGYENIDLDKMMEEDVEKKRSASHVVDIEMETGVVVTLSAVGDFSPQSFSLAYALTVHKAQGCEWRKVFFILHKNHAILANRELLYTGVTRAREQLVMIAKDSMIAKAIKNQRIKGNTIAEKIAFFNAGLMNVQDVQCVKTAY